MHRLASGRAALIQAFGRVRRRLAANRPVSAAPGRSGGQGGFRDRAEAMLLLRVRPLLILVLLPYGSTGPIAMPIATLAVSLWCALACLVSAPRSRAAGTALLVAACLAVWVLAQASPWLPPDPVRQAAGAILGEGLPAGLSVAPSLTLAALPALVTPILLFAALAGFDLGRRRALSLVRFMAGAGTAVAAFGIAQHLLAPDMLLLSEKRSYLGSLTAVFVNRNTAATFLGCTALMLAALAAYDFSGRPVLGLVLGVGARRDVAAGRRRLLLHGGALFVVVLALFLTQSRGGVAATALAAGLLRALRPAPRRARAPAVTARRPGWRDRRARVLSGVGIAVAGMAVLVVFGGRTLWRVQMDLGSDGRFCVLPGLLRTVAQAWPLGTGAGTFALAFAPNRDPDCGIYGTWDRAHDIFLEGLVTLGAPFVALCLLAYGTLAWVLISGLARRRQLRFMPVLGLSALALVTLHGLVDFSLQIPAIAIWIAVLLAVCCCVSERPADTGRDRGHLSKSR